jgi:hypothetical protein
MLCRFVSELVVTFALTPLPTASASDPVPAPPELQAANNEDLRVRFRGRVTAVTKKTVTIKPEGRANASNSQ